MNVTSVSTYTDTIFSVGIRVFTIDYNYTDTVLCTQDQVPQHDRHSVHLLTSWTATRITDRTILDPDLSKNIFSDSV